MTMALTALGIAAAVLAALIVLVVIAFIVGAIIGSIALVRAWRDGRLGAALAGTDEDSRGPDRSFPRERSIFGVPAESIRRPEQQVFGAPLAAALVGVLAGGWALIDNGLDPLVVPTAGLVAVGLLVAIAGQARRTGRGDRLGIMLVGFAILVSVGLLLLPEYLYGAQVNAVIHRSAISAPLLLVLSVLTLSYALRGLLGGTPTAEDASFYPLVAVPVLLVLAAYGLLLGRVVVQGAGGISLDLLTTAWGQVAVGDPAAQTFVYQTGLRNHILGTLLLMALTCVISFIPGVAVGVFLSEYPGRISRVIGFSTTMLRAMSVFIIGVAALGFVGAAVDLPATSLLSQLIRGSFSLERDGVVQPGSGSFVTASVFLSLLVIPIIARLTEEGLRSVPRDIREGSVAAGATDEYGLRRILLPWAGPNIVTGLLLGAAEAAGSLAIVMFIAGNGEHGVGPLSSVTTLDYALFSTRFGSQPFIQTMGYRAPTDYAFTSALVLLFIVLGLTIVAMWMRRRFARRYRGSLTVG
jgi:phosphate transport system permease protein